MTGLTIRNSASISATVSLLDFAREIQIDWDRLDSIVAQLEALRFVDYVEDRHQFWIRLELETSSFTTAERRTKTVLTKVENLLRRYRKAA